MNSVFKWDGSELIDFTTTNIIEKITVNSYEYWVITYQTERTLALIRKTKCYTPCLVDELKPLFGLEKLGTHYVKIDSKFTILIRARINPERTHILAEYRLNNIEVKSLSENDIDQIRRIYVFRDLLCLSKSNDNSLIVRKTGVITGIKKGKIEEIGETTKTEGNTETEGTTGIEGATETGGTTKTGGTTETENKEEPEVFTPEQRLHILSFIDSHIDLKKLIDITHSTYLPETVFNKWFKNISPNVLLFKMCKIYKSSNLINRTFKLKLEIEEMSCRVAGGKLNGFPGILINRIITKLQGK